MSTLFGQATRILAAGSLLAGGAAHAAERVEIRTAGLQHQEWRAGLATATLDLRSERPALQVYLERFESTRFEARSVKITCADLALQGSAAGCAAGQVRVVSSGQPTLTEPFTFDYRPARGALDLSASGGLLDMRWRLTLRQSAHDQALHLGASGDASSIVSRLLAPTGLWPAAWPAPAPGHHLQADASLHGRASGRGVVTVSVEQLDFAAADGLQAGEGLSARVELKGSRDGDRWSASAQATADQGALYLHPLFFDFSAEPLQLSATGQVTDRHTDRQWRLRSAQARQQGLVVEASDLLWHTDSGWRSGRLHAQAADAQYLLERYLAPWAPAALEAVTLQGAVAAWTQWRDGALSGAGLHSEALSLRREPGPQALQQCTGNLLWRAGSTEPLHLACAGGRVGQIPFGAFSARGRLGPEGLHIATLPVPLLKGMARFDDVRMTHTGGSWSDGLDGAMGLQLSGLSLPALSTALGWPEISGQLNARVPKLELRGDDLRLHGRLDLELLDGRAWLEQVTIEDLLGTVPELRGHLELRGLDLEQLTRAFSFGSISGRVDGYIRDLHLERWEPVAFDAALYSTPGDRSRRRISQRAIENLSSLGGASGALQGGMLRFFDQFRYRRLGIHCTLRRSVCLLGGIEPLDEDSYYIVQPGGLWPRISVIGHERLVDWPVLLRRLQRVTRSGPAAAAPRATTDG